MTKQLGQDVDFSQSEPYVCEECGHTVFQVRYVIKRFSALVSPTGNETIIPVSCFACVECGHINKDFMPETDML